MDKDLLRLVILIVGGLVIVGMILWGIISNRQKGKRINFYDKRPLDKIDPNLVLNTDDDDFDIVPINTRDNDEYDDYQLSTRSLRSLQNNEEHLDDGDMNFDLDLNLDFQLEEDKFEEAIAEKPKVAKTPKQLPSLLQLSIVAKDESGFSEPSY